MDKFTPGEEGIFLNLPESVYRSAPGENFSRLKPMAQSPKKYLYELNNPKPRTAAMVFGTVVHAMLLEPDKLSDLIVTRPEQWDSYRTKEAKAWRDSQTAMVVTDDELADMRDCAAAVKADPKAAWILQAAEKEVSVFKRHEGTGLLLKGRLDLPFTDLQGNTAIADIKKVTSVKRGLMRKAIGDRLIHVQGAFYCNLLGASSFYIIAVEEAPPHEVDIFEVPKVSLQRGREWYESMLARLVRCKAENRWPGVSEDSDTIQEIEEPEWCRMKEEALY